MKRTAKGDALAVMVVKPDRKVRVSVFNFNTGDLIADVVPEIDVTDDALLLSDDEGKINHYTLSD
jgi:hypothetical protein